MNSNFSFTMKKTFFTLLVIISVLIPVSGQKILSDSLIVAPFGKVYIYKQCPDPQNVIIMISGDAGWRYGVPEFARVFSGMKTLVIGVDILRYYRSLRARSTDCYMVASDFVELATAAEKKYNFLGYIPPVVMGYSSGATLVYGILAQARPGTFIGGISLGFCTDIELPAMLCQVNGLTGKAIKEGKSYLLMPDARLGNPWIVLQGKKDKICDFLTVYDFVSRTVNAELIEIPETGHDFSRMADFMPKWKDAYNRLISKYQAAEPINTTTPVPANIPYNITREKTNEINAPLALFFSGDGGWYGFEQSIADKFSMNGIPTIGIDTKKYFWERRTPEETSNQMAALLNYYCKELGRTRILLIGYSQGAEIMPFVVNRLPENIKSNISSVIMLSPETKTDFEIHITNMLGLGSRQNTYDVIEELIKMKNIPALCIFGDNEKSTVPGLLKNTDIKIVFIPGDHHYKSNETLIVQTMKDKNAF